MAHDAVHQYRQEYTESRTKTHCSQHLQGIKAAAGCRGSSINGHQINSGWVSHRDHH
jgi:hypothetical protein